jgi:hypothetical protein
MIGIDPAEQNRRIQLRVGSKYDPAIGRQFMRRLISKGRTLPVAFLAVAMSTAATARVEAATSQALAPQQLYGNSLEFDIQRNGEPVGTHRVTFSKQNGELAVSTDSSIVVRFLSVPIYRFTYNSTTLWRDGTLESLKAVTNDDGKVSTVMALVKGNQAQINGPAGNFDATLPIFATEHWNPAELQQKTVLNAITGKLDHVQVKDAGASEVETTSGPRAADRYDVSGDLQFTAWYDPRGRWIGLSFKGKDDSTISYICRRCAPDMTE